MIQVLLFAYVVIKWLGAWSLYHGVLAVLLYSGLCVFAAMSFVMGVLSPGALRAISAMIGGGSDSVPGILITLVLWLLFFILYPLGLVDWLVALHLLETNEGYLISHQTPSTFDSMTLIIAIAMVIALVFKIKKVIKEKFLM